MPPPKPPLVTKLKVAGEAGMHPGGGRNRMDDLSPLSPAKRGRDDDRVDESTDGVGAPSRPQTGGTASIVTLGRGSAMVPLVPTSTGTRYGRGLTGVGGGTNRQWGGSGTPVCGKCGKLVYFAEQVSGEKKIGDQTLTHLRRRKPSVKRFTRAACAVLNATLGWTQEGSPREMHGLIVTDVMQRCDVSFHSHAR